MNNKLIKSFKEDNLLCIRDIFLVVFQFGLIVLHFFSFKSIDIFSELIITNIFGLNLIILGLILIIISLKGLGTNITVFPLWINKEVTCKLFKDLAINSLYYVN